MCEQRGGLPSPVHKPGHSAMFFLTTPLRVTVDSNNKKSNEHLISLRDYDFVGPDQRLAALLAERMAVLQAPVDMPEPEPEPAADLAKPLPQAPFPIKFKPDYLQSNVRDQVVNVSMDYGPIDWLLEVNASSPPAMVPGPGGPPAMVPGPGGSPASRIGRISEPSQDARRGSVDGRRQDAYNNPNNVAHNRKLLEMMKQCIYTAQRKLLELETFMLKYVRDPRFRMAFIYHRLDEWLFKMRIISRYMDTNSWPWRGVKRILWYYENQLRLNIDITYSIEHMVYLHGQFKKRMDILLPAKQREDLKQQKQLQRKLQRMEKLGLTTAKPTRGPLKITMP